MSGPRPRRHVLAMHRLIVGLVLLSGFPVLGGFMRLSGLATGGGGLESQERFAADPVPAVLHILCGMCFATIGALQFSPALRRRSWHRLAGRVLAPMGVVVALSALWMTLRWTPKEYDSLALVASRVVVGVAMLVFIALSLVAVRRRDFVAHGRWMTRAYALGAAAGTQAFTLMPFLVPSVRSPASYAVLMGAGWVINLAVAEWLIRRQVEPVPRVTRVAQPTTGEQEVTREEMA
jgi:hypothetical protein